MSDTNKAFPRGEEMMTLSERLRPAHDRADGEYVEIHAKTLREAAAELDRLTAENAELKNAASEVLRISDRTHAAWDRLRNAVENGALALPAAAMMFVALKEAERLITKNSEFFSDDEYDPLIHLIRGAIAGSGIAPDAALTARVAELEEALR